MDTTQKVITMTGIRQVTWDDFIKGRDKTTPMSAELKENANTTIHRVNLLLKKFGEYRWVTSGYRPPEVNSKTPNAALHSKHLTCEACDLLDSLGDLDRFCVQNQDFLSEIGLWLESPTDTPGWTHVQIVGPKSGHRIFIP